MKRAAARRLTYVSHRATLLSLDVSESGIARGAIRAKIYQDEHLYEYSQLANCLFVGRESTEDSIPTTTSPTDSTPVGGPRVLVRSGCQQRPPSWIAPTVWSRSPSLVISQSPAERWVGGTGVNRQMAQKYRLSNRLFTTHGAFVAWSSRSLSLFPIELLDTKSARWRARVVSRSYLQL